MSKSSIVAAGSEVATALPNFIGIGAQRAATTWLYECLRQHPQVFVPQTKEVSFFHYNFDKGLDWYREHFRGAGAYRASTEITPTYIAHRDAIDQIAQVLPEARLYVVLRDPVDRALSAYQLFVGNGKCKDLTFREACQRHAHFVQFGMYAQQLREVYSHFPRESVMVLFYEDVKRSPDMVLEQLFTFMGVDASFRPAATDKVVNRFMYADAQRALERFGMRWAVEMVKRTPLGDWIRKRHKSRNDQKTLSVDPEFMNELRDGFRDDILELQDLVGRDLSMWLKHT